MKLSKFQKGFRRLMLPLGVLAVLGILVVSCSKKDGNGAPSQKLSEEEKVEKIKELIARMPAFELQTKDGKTLRVERTENGGFTFSNPPSQTGYNYSTSTGAYTYVDKSSSGGTIVLTSGGFGGNTGGGVIVAGSKSYDMKYTFCLTADEEFGLDILGDDFTGVSMVVGVDGDFDKIINGDADAEGDDFTDLFRAFAFYIVYDSPASGSYDIVNWLTSLDLEESKLKNKGFAVVMDIKDGYMFFSKSGQLSVNEGSIGFSGTYFQIEMAFDSEGDIDASDVTEVTGAGVLGCN